MLAVRQPGRTTAGDAALQPRLPAQSAVASRRRVQIIAGLIVAAISAEWWFSMPTRASTGAGATSEASGPQVAAVIEASSPPGRDADLVSPVNAELDLCVVMAQAGAQDVGSARLELFVPLREARPGVAAVRGRRCSFRSYGVPRDRYQDLQLAISAGPDTAGRFLSAMQVAQSDAAAHFAVEEGLGVAGYARAMGSSREIELHYLLGNDRRLTVRWAGEGTDPQADITRLREFARRAAEQMP